MRRSRPLLTISAAAAATLFADRAHASGDRALGEYLSSECVACHQISGRKVGGIPAIVGWPEDQFIAVIESYKNKQRENQVMQTIAAKLSKDEIEALAAYFGALKPAN